MNTQHEDALTKYKPVRYSHVKVEPGFDHVLTADPWSYLHGFLIKDQDKRRGNNKKNYQRAIFYAQLAKEFYKGADAVELPSKTTLLYYGMLNLVKSLLSTRGVELETTMEHHGLNLPLGQRPKVRVASANTDALSIFACFSELMGTPITATSDIDLKQVFKNIPELHGVYTNNYPNEKQKFIPVTINFKTNRQHNILFTTMEYEKKIEGLVKIRKLHSGARKAYFKEPYNYKDKVILRSKQTKRPQNFNKLEITYTNILKEYDSLDIASMLTNKGYFYYCDLEPGEYHHLCYTLMAMFYLGTASRYRPTLIQEQMNGNMLPLITECSALCPKQFLYNLVSIITKKLCVKPFAAI